MPQYEIFGGTLHSDLDLPALRAAGDGAADWTLTVGRGDAPQAGMMLGRQDVSDGVWIEAYELPTGIRIHYSDAGSFDIAADGRTIVYYGGPDVPVVDVRDCLIGRVFSTVLHLQGKLCLHGSAVAPGSEAIAFLAPKHHGKSTLALAITRAGGRLATDDAVIVGPADGERAVVYPGVHSVRLFDDSASVLTTRDTGVHAPFSFKHTLADLPDERLLLEPAPLGAVYLLARLDDPACEQPVRRTRLAPFVAAAQVAQHVKLGDLLGAHEARVLFDRALDVVRGAPVYVLEVVRDYGRLDDVVRQLLTWHAAADAPDAAIPVAARVGA